MNSMRGELEKALSNVGRDFEEDQLAFLTLTSKPELQIRDALAWRLHRALPDLIVSREWRRTDLAVLDRAGNPLMLLEAKAMATFDQVNPKKMDGEFDSYFRSDYKKASRLAQDVTEIFILIISAHIATAAPDELRAVIKYPNIINGSLRRFSPVELHERAKHDFLSHLERNFETEESTFRIGSRRAFGIGCSVETTLVGPLQPH